MAMLELLLRLPITNTAYAGGFDAVFKFNIANLGVQSTNPIPTSARLENEDGNFFIVMPQASGGRVRIVGCC